MNQRHPVGIAEQRGLTPPSELEGLPRTLPTKKKPGREDGGPFYDQIAWFVEGGRRKLTLDYRGTAGSFHFDQHVLTGLTRNELSFRVSDHYPLWVEFLVP